MRQVLFQVLPLVIFNTDAILVLGPSIAHGNKCLLLRNTIVLYPIRMKL